jgi:hypothetical protein
VYTVLVCTVCLLVFAHSLAHACTYLLKGLHVRLHSIALHCTALHCTAHAIALHCIFMFVCVWACTLDSVHVRCICMHTIMRMHLHMRMHA